MDESAAVRRVERRANLSHDAQRASERQGTLLRQECLEIASFHGRHGDVEKAVYLTRVVDRDDVRVVEGRGELRLPEEALPKVSLAERRSQQLQCGGSAEANVLREVDDAGRPLAERLDDAIAAELRADPTIRPHGCNF